MIPVEADRNEDLQKWLELFLTALNLSEFSYTIDEQALHHAHMMDGKLLVTNTTDLTSDVVLKRYKSLADIEREFRVLKSKIEIGLIYHRLPNRIRAHAKICFIALLLCW